MCVSLATVPLFPTAARLLALHRAGRGAAAILQLALPIQACIACLPNCHPLSQPRTELAEVPAEPEESEEEAAEEEEEEEEEPKPKAKAKKGGRGKKAAAGGAKKPAARKRSAKA